MTYDIQRYGGHTMGWTNPWVLADLIGGTLTLAVFCIMGTKVAEPMFSLRLFRNAAFTGGNAATLLDAIARGGLQFSITSLTSDSLSAEWPRVVKMRRRMAFAGPYRGPSPGIAGRYAPSRK